MLLLLTLGVTSAVAFTEQGHWAAERVVQALSPTVRPHVPLMLMAATGSASRGVEVIRLCADMQVDGPEGKPRVVPTPDEVARRLAGVDGWSTAVMYEQSVGVGGLYEAGLGDIETCGRVFGMPPPRERQASVAPKLEPVQRWRLLLLNQEGRYVGSGSLSALRPGWAPSETDPDAWVESAVEPGDGVLPPVCVFRRLASGEVVRD